MLSNRCHQHRRVRAVRQPETELFRHPVSGFQWNSECSHSGSRCNRPRFYLARQWRSTKGRSVVGRRPLRAYREAHRPLVTVAWPRENRSSKLPMRPRGFEPPRPIRVTRPSTLYEKCSLCPMRPFAVFLSGDVDDLDPPGHSGCCQRVVTGRRFNGATSVVGPIRAATTRSARRGTQSQGCPLPPSREGSTLQRRRGPDTFRVQSSVALSKWEGVSAREHTSALSWHPRSTEGGQHAAHGKVAPHHHVYGGAR